MITTVRADITWEGQMAKAINSSSEKKVKQTLKDLTGAADIDIIKVDSWDEYEDEGWDE